MSDYFRKNLLLVTVIFVASVLRLYQLDSNPPALKWDEVALGYNAYSILKTGKDEFGNLLPVIYKSFGDYKPGMYVYADIPFISVLGLNELATRLPGAIAGIISVLMVYLIVKEIFGENVAIWPAVALAFSPWHILFSRGAWEANLAIFFLLCGLFFFLKSRPLLWGIFFGLTFLTYQGAKVFTPIFLLLVLFLLTKKLNKDTKKNLIVGGVTVLVFLIPIFLSLFSAAGGRAKVASVFSYPRPQVDINEILTQDKTNLKSVIYYLFHSETYNFIRGIAERYFNTFSGKYLFFEGDWQNPRLGVPYMGELYFFDLFFLILGTFYLIRLRDPRISVFALLWLLASPIPAAITRDSVSSVRSLNMVIPLSIIIGLGFYFLYERLKNQNFFLRTIFFVLIILGYAWNFMYFNDLYYLHGPIHNSSTGQYGYKEVVNFINSLNKKYDRIYFTDRYGQPYIYWLFYTKYSPSRYQESDHFQENIWGDVGKVEQLDNIKFGNVYWPNIRNCKNCLAVDSEMGLPENDILNTAGAKVIKRINFLNGQLAFKVVETSN